jgi:NAD(P)-dependent dehydrogenase (short-subunit alcohol dehydrogenase family)
MINTIFKEGLFKNKVVLVTGGGTGIGLRIAREFCQLGAKAVIASRKMEKLTKGLKVLTDEGGEAIALECNIRDEESIKSCVSSAISTFGKIDILVNNGGGQFPSPAEFINRKGWHAVIETNLTGTFFLTQEVFNQSMNKYGGSIINITMDNRNGFPMLAHSAAARAGVQNLTMSLATEWGKYGVRVNTISPGTIESSGLDTYAPGISGIRSCLRQEQPACYRIRHRGGSGGCRRCLSKHRQQQSFITGVNLAVDGGESLYTPLMPPIENDKNEPFSDV